jgi:hypothetical protein
MVDLRAAGDPGQSVSQQRVSGDLAFKDAWQRCVANPTEALPGWPETDEHAGQCIKIWLSKALISALCL